MLELQRVHDVQHPGEAEDGVDNHGCVVPPYLLVAEFLAQEGVARTRVAERPVVVNVPEGGVGGIDDSEGDEGGFIGAGLVHAVDTEGHVVDDGCEVFAAIEEMGEFVACVPVAADALEGAPDAGEAGEEAHGAQVGGVALRGLVPAAGVQAKE